MWVVDYVRTPDDWLIILLTQGLTIINASLLSMVIYRAKASSHFSLVPALLYVATIGIFPYLRVHWQPQLIVGILLFFLLTTRDMSDTSESNGVVFFTTLLLCLTSLLVPDALWCIFLIWIVVLLQGAFSLRTVFASLLAVLLVIVYYVLLMYVGCVDAWDPSVLLDRQWVGMRVPSALAVSVGLLMIGFLLVTGGAFARSTYDLVSTRMLLYHTVVWGLMSAPLVLFSASEQDSWVLTTIALSGTTGIFLLQKESEARGVTFLLYLIGATALYFWLVFSL